jgi:hypothetical protein
MWVTLGFLALTSDVPFKYIVKYIELSDNPIGLRADCGSSTSFYADDAVSWD